MYIQHLSYIQHVSLICPIRVATPELVQFPCEISHLTFNFCPLSFTAEVWLLCIPFGSPNSTSPIYPTIYPRRRQRGWYSERIPGSLVNLAPFGKIYGWGGSGIRDIQQRLYARGPVPCIAVVSGAPSVVAPACVCPVQSLS